MPRPLVYILSKVRLIITSDRRLPTVPHTVPYCTLPLLLMF